MHSKRHVAIALQAVPPQDAKEKRVLQLQKDHPPITSEDKDSLLSFPGAIAYYVEEHLPDQQGFLLMRSSQDVDRLFEQKATLFPRFYVKPIPDPSLIQLQLPVLVARPPQAGSQSLQQSLQQQPQQQFQADNQQLPGSAHGHSSLRHRPLVTAAHSYYQQPLQGNASSHNYSGQPTYAAAPMHSPLQTRPTMQSSSGPSSLHPGQRPLQSQFVGQPSRVPSHSAAGVQSGMAATPAFSAQQMQQPSVPAQHMQPPFNPPQMQHPSSQPIVWKSYPTQAIVRFPGGQNAVNQLRKLTLLPEREMYSYRILKNSGNSMRIEYSDPLLVQTLMSSNPREKGVFFYNDKLDFYMPLHDAEPGAAPETQNAAAGQPNGLYPSQHVLQRSVSKYG
jgi:hypothetical protein